MCAVIKIAFYRDLYAEYSMKMQYSQCRCQIVFVRQPNASYKITTNTVYGYQYMSVLI